MSISCGVMVYARYLWNEVWIGDTQLSVMFPRIYALEINKDCTEDCLALVPSVADWLRISSGVCRWWNLSWTPLGSYADWLNWFNSIRLSSKVKDLLEGVLYITWGNCACCGTRIRFWKDIWVGETPLFTRYNRLYHLDQDKDCLIIDRINNGQWSWNWSRTNLGVRNLAYLCDMLNEIGQLNIDVNEDYGVLDSWSKVLLPLSIDCQNGVGQCTQHIIAQFSRVSNNDLMFYSIPVLNDLKVGKAPEQGSNDVKRIRYKQAHEAARKDVERAFGVLKKKWAIVRTPARSRSLKRITHLMYTCIILHNMIRKEKGKTISPDFYPEEQHREDNLIRSAQDRLRVIREIHDEETHLNLKADLVEHIWHRTNAN
ncbi:putative nuclease HARBI1 isoform X2 [Tanacetum coccineum]